MNNDLRTGGRRVTDRRKGRQGRKEEGKIIDYMQEKDLLEGEKKNLNR